MTIQRYSLEMDGEMELDHCGDWVRYDDLVPTSQWRSMDSAPRDGTHILVCRSPATTRPPINKAWWGTARMANKGWNISNKRPLSYEPTHWMPLPDAPPTKDLADAGKEKT